MDLGGDLGGYLWLIIDIGFVAGLAAVMIYATYKWRQRRKDRSMQEAEKQAVERTATEAVKASLFLRAICLSKSSQFAAFDEANYLSIRSIWPNI
jgi:beta-lactamase regulating signal transducer with metallopeptidase domain